jgi:hypothetical protein
MKTNINLHNAMWQCRIARHQGKISTETQQRTLRRLLRSQGVQMEPITLDRWGTLMAFRQQIEQEITPQLEAVRRARHELFHCKGETLPATKITPLPIPYSITPPPINPRFNADWWAACEAKESAQKAAALKAAYA